MALLVIREEFKKTLSKYNAHGNVLMALSKQIENALNAISPKNLTKL